VVGVFGGIERGCDLVKVGVDVSVHLGRDLKHDFLRDRARARGSVVAVNEVAVVVLEWLLIGGDEHIEPLHVSGGDVACAIC
jgi:hypothetical protein